MGGVTRYYPLFADLSDRTCLVVGGGPVGEERARRLAECGARVRLVAPAVTPGLRAMAAEGTVAELRERPYAPADLDGCTLAVAATAEPSVNEAVLAGARARGVLCSTADAGARGDFIVPGVVRRGDLVIAVSTSGASPTAAAHVRGRLDAEFGPEWEDLLRLLGDARAELRRRHPDGAERRARVAAVLDGEVAALLARGDRAAATRRARELLGLEEAAACT